MSKWKYYKDLVLVGIYEFGALLLDRGDAVDWIGWILASGMVFGLLVLPALFLSAYKLPDGNYYVPVLSCVIPALCAFLFFVLGPAIKKVCGIAINAVRKWAKSWHDNAKRRLDDAYRHSNDPDDSSPGGNT